MRAVAEPGRLFAEQSLLSLARDAITVTCLFLERIAIEDGDAAARIRENVRSLKDAHRDRNAGAPHPEHDRQKLLRELELVSVDTIVCHENPTSAPLVDGVKAIARNRLRHLVAEVLRKERASLTHGRTLIDDPSKGIRGHTPRIALDLDQHF